MIWKTAPAAFVASVLALAPLSLSAQAPQWQLTSSHRVQDMAVGNGRIVSVGGVQGGVHASTNGIAWTTITFDLTCRCICFGNGYFWIVTEDNHLYRTDGVSVPVLVKMNLRARDIAFGNGRLVAPCTNEQAGIYFSANGTDWVRGMMPVDFNEQRSKVIFANGTFVVSSPDKIFSSSDGGLWKVRDTSYNAAGPIAYGNGRFLILGSTSNSSLYNLYSSSDGDSWVRKEITMWNFNGVSDLHFAGGSFYLVGSSSYVGISTEGETWTQEYSGVSFGLNSISSIGGTFVAGGNQVISKAGSDPVVSPPPPLAIHPAVEIRFGTVPGGIYRIEASGDLNSWSTIESNIPGDGGTMGRLYSTQAQGNRYFRVVTD